MDAITKQDLERLQTSLEASFRRILKEEFMNLPVSPSRFSYETGMPYSTVINHCKQGLLKAFQDRPGAAWWIEATELERIKTSHP